MDCSPELVDLVAASPRLAPHFHLPLQHASDEMLAAMRRPYSLAYFGALVDRIRTRMPHASIGSDVIVGFPGETDAHASAAARLRERVAADPRARLSLFAPAGDGGERAGRHAGAADRAAARRRAAQRRASAWRVRSGPRRPAASAARWWWTTARRPSPTTTCAWRSTCRARATSGSTSRSWTGRAAGSSFTEAGRKTRGHGFVRPARGG